MAYLLAAQAAYSAYESNQNSNAGTQTSGGSGSTTGSTAPPPGGSSVNNRNQITVAPIGVNLGSVIQPYIEGSETNGGSGASFDSPMSAGYMPAPYRSSHVSNSPYGTQLGYDLTNPDGAVGGSSMYVILGALALVAVVGVTLIRKRRR